MKELFAGIFAAIVALLASGTIYPQTFLIADVSPDDNTLTLVSAAKVEYVCAVPENTLPNYAPGDLVAAVMYNAGTPDDPQDDQVMAIHASGFSIQPRSADRTEDEIMLFRTDSLLLTPTRQTRPRRE